MYLNQIWYKDAHMSLFKLCQIWRQSDYMFAFYSSFLQVCKKKEKKEKKKRRKWVTFCNWRLIFQERLTWFALNLVCILSQYAGICTVNLVLFGLETTELWTHVKSYFVLRVQIFTLCAYALFSWTTWHDTLYCVSWYVYPELAVFISYLGC